MDEHRPGFWEGYSEVYSGDIQGDAPSRIIDRLFDLGLLTGNDCVLEIGSGPGTYSLLIAPRVRILVCMDSSAGMLDRLRAGAETLGISNIERFLQDWNAYTPRKGYDTCIATLCPGTGASDSLLRMEGASRRGCALVSWMRNPCDDMHDRLCGLLETEKPDRGRGSSEPEEWLACNDREFTVETFPTVYDWKATVDVAVSS